MRKFRIRSTRSLNDEVDGGFLPDFRVVLLVTIIVLKVCILCVLAMNSIVVMDEFVQLGWAKYLGVGLFDTIWPVKAVGYAVFYKMAHLIGWDSVSTILIGRAMTTVIACAIVAMVYASSRALQHSRPAALLVIVVLLSFSNFIERIFRTRAEPLAVFFAVASLLVLMRGRPTFRRIFIAGILTGLAFITTQKSIYFNVAIGAALVGDALYLRDMRLAGSRAVWLLAGWLLPITVYIVAFGGTDPWPVADNLFLGPAALVSEVPRLYRDMDRFVIDTLVKNGLLYAMCLAGIGVSLKRIHRLESRERIALIFSVIVCIFVFSHNQPWPYIFVMALPFISLWAASLVEQIAKIPSMRIIFVSALTLAVLLSFVRNGHYYLHFGNSHQMSVVRNAERVTGSTDYYFDGVGMLPNRREPSDLWLDLPLVRQTLEQGEDSELYLIFERAPPKTLIWSYRMDAVAPVIQEIIDSSYVRVAPNIFVAGTELNNGTPTFFKPPIAGWYNLYSRTGQLLRGRVVRDGEEIELPIFLAREASDIELVDGPVNALLVPEGDYGNVFDRRAPDIALFAGVYD